MTWDLSQFKIQGLKMNEILLYKTITAQTAEEFIQNLNWISQDSVFTVRFYTAGGDVQAAWGMWAKINELRSRGCISIGQVDGLAASMGAYLLCAFDKRKALSVSEIMVHRAEINTEMEDGTTYKPSPQELEWIKRLNVDLRNRLTDIVNNEKLKAIKGYGIEELFDEKIERIDCSLTADEAYQIGLVTEIIPLTSANKEIPVKAEALYKQTAVEAKINPKK